MKKTLTVILALVLVVVMSVAGTVAYLTSSDTVTNSFTVGKVEITLDETDVDLYGSKDGETRVAENIYKLIPGHTYTKDPVIHVDADSEACWLFVKVENALDGKEGTNTIAAQMSAKGWTATATGSNIYAYSTKVNGGAEVSVFDTFTVGGAVDVSSLEGAKIVVTAYAVQADGFATAEAALAAAPFPAA